MLTQTKSHRLDDPCVTAGDRLYAIGSQDGLFPREGGHIENEMHGIWANDIKLADGFCAWIDGEPLARATAYTQFAFEGRYTYRLDAQGLMIEREQWVPDGEPGLCVRWTITDLRGEARDVALDIGVCSNLRGCWLMPCEDGQDRIEARDGALLALDALNPWSAAFRADGGERLSAGAVEDFGRPFDAGAATGACGRIALRLAIPANGAAAARLVIAGGKAGEGEALALSSRLLADWDALHAEKAARVERMFAAARVDLPGRIQDAWAWTCAGNDWLYRDVPGLGAGYGAGFPEYPWWFGCDSTYALLGLIPLGEWDRIEATLRTLRDVSLRHNGCGRVMHEVGFGGQVFNPGNTQETAQYVKFVGQYIDWSGRAGFLREMMPFLGQCMDWLMEQSDEMGLPTGYGIIEIAGLNARLIDTAAMTVCALRAYAKMLDQLDRPGADAHRAKADRLCAVIESLYWREADGEYADFAATPEEALSSLPIMRGENKRGDAQAFALLDRVEREAKAAVPGEVTAFNTRNWVSAVPMCEGIAQPDRANRALDNLRGPDAIGRFGGQLAFTGGAYMMTITTAVLAEAYGRYARIDEMAGMIDLIASTFHLRAPGAASEMSPDWGCFVQAWTGYGITWPIASYLFGIQPDAHNRHIDWKPALPTGWTGWKVDALPVGDARVSASCERLDSARARYVLSIDQKGWTVTVGGATRPMNAQIEWIG